MELTIKPMEAEEEIRGKASVHYQAWQEAYAGLVSEAYLAALTPQRCEELARRAPENTLIALKDGKVIGFTAFGICRDEDAAETGEIFALYVLAAFYGSGVGRRLMEEALARLAPYRRVAVWVLEGNRRAIRFYEKCGFSLYGCTRTLRLGEPVTAVRMALHRQGA